MGGLYGGFKVEHVGLIEQHQEMMKQGRTQRKPGKKWLVGGRFGNQSTEPVTIGKILSTQKDLPPADICALLDFQDPTVQSSLDRGGLAAFVQDGVGVGLSRCH